MLYGLNGARILTPQGLKRNHTLLFDEKIQALILSEEASLSGSHYSIGGTIHECRQLPDNWIISPGFVDIHIHGCSGHDVMDATPEALAGMAQTLVTKGVTSFLGATMTMSRQDIESALINAQVYLSAPNQTHAAKFCGIHLEGPFISKKALGAQNPAFVQAPDMTLIERFHDVIRMVTYAPEEDPEFAFTRQLAAMGITASIGHTACSYDTARLAYQAGATHMTHLFNAMTALHHREPGAVGAALSLDFTVELIADDVHVRPELYALLHRLKKDRLALITDSMRAGCMKCGSYQLGGQKVLVDEHSARLENGVLAGSILTMDQALRNFYRGILHHSEGRECPNPEDLLAEVLMAVSAVPAIASGLHHAGSLSEGKPADLTILDEQLEVRMTFVDGRLAYEKI